MPKDKKSPEDRYRIYSRIEDISGIFLLFGLFVETTAVFLFSKGKTNLEIFMEVLSYMVVFGGVFGEMYGASKARTANLEIKVKSETLLSEAINRASKLEAEAAEARKRAAEIEKITAWRRISREQYDAIFEILREPGKLPTQIVVGHAIDAESSMYAKEIANLLSAIIKNRVSRRQEDVQFGRNVEGSLVSFEYDPVFGLYISSIPPAYAITVRDAFNSVGLEAKIDSDVSEGFLRDLTKGPGRPLFLHIHVSYKPAPE